VLHRQARLSEAETSLRQAIQLRPNYAEAHSTLGNVLREFQRLDEAEASCRQAITLNPNSSSAYTHLALVLEEQGKHAVALACRQRANELAAKQAEEILRSGRAFQESRQFEQAEASLRQAMRVQPGSAAIHTALASLLQESGKPDQAEAEFREALRLEPTAHAHDNLGTALARQGKNAAARAQFLQALALAPGLINAMTNAGNTLASEGELAEAVQYFSQALQLNPDSAEAHYSRAMVRLLQGDFERGWPEYEWRWRARGVRRIQPNFQQPLWDGSPLNGRTILLHTEGGFGDTVQFIRYAPRIKQRGGTVLFDSHPAMVELLSRSEGIDQIIPRGAPLPAFDVHAPLMSLPYIFGTRVETIPAAVPYISIDPALVERWRQEMAGLRGFKIGIAWQGSPVHYHDRVRSFPLKCFEPLARLAGVHLISLQKHAGREQIPEFAVRFPIADLGDRLDEASGAYLDTPAAMLSLDLVITPDSSLAHVAGALGVPVWLALPHVPEFRWLLDREDSPWYPTMRLFRQTSPGNWPGVFERMAAELAERLSRGS
jgi:tetratricopeptide (TPR) repeat protein